jgi:hypothetical protein
VTFSKSAGTLFKQGVHSSTLALIDASRSPVGTVVLLDDGQSAAGEWLAESRLTSNHTIAWPRCGVQAACEAVGAELRNHSEMFNAAVRVRGLAYLAAAYASFESNRGVRNEVSCLNELVPLDGNALAQLDCARTLRDRFG